MHNMICIIQYNRIKYKIVSYDTSSSDIILDKLYNTISNETILYLLRNYIS